MPYRIRYQLNVDFIPAGRGLAMDAAAVTEVSGGAAQTILLQDSQPVGSNTFTATDISNLLATMSTDLTTQMTANQARIQGFATGSG